ncbi:hypothetical protein RintRC_6094 [Richelia intracellularis]|nr:hypothetical protein RintRC_6094 [Richelia intracellularis]
MTFLQSQRPKGKELKTATDALQVSLMNLLPQNYHDPDELNRDFSQVRKKHLDDPDLG